MVATGGEKKKSRVLSGMRPTGRMHIGNYFGALANWVRLQNDPTYECFYFIADWHSLTSDYADTSAIAENTLQIMIDYLAGGLDPAKSVLFLQSLVPEHAELHLLLSMVTPLGWLERVPTYKEALENIKDKDLHNYGFLGYPVLQCADIVMYSEPGAQLFVPVGEDQVSHVETSREIVRRFNLFNGLELKNELFLDSSNWALLSQLCPPAFQSGAFQADAFQTGIRLPNKGEAFTDSRIAEAKSLIKRRMQSDGIDNFCKRFENYGFCRRFVIRHEILSEPGHMLTKTPKVPGLDGRKMSKSYGNAIMLSESDADIRAKTKVMVTDPARKRRTDPGNPDVCPVYDWHKLFSAEEPGRLEWVRQGCTSAGIGCIECKEAMANNLIKWIAPIRERRAYYEGKKKLVRQIIQDGSLEARKVAVHTMRMVRDAVFGRERILRKTLPGPARTKRRASRARAGSD